MSTPPTVPYAANPADPDLTDVLNLWKKDVFLSFNAHHLGTITSFNATQQTARATINYRKTYFRLDTETNLYVAELVPYPQAIDCPVIVFGGGNGLSTMPIAAGDECLILFNDRDINNWFSGSPSGAVATSRLHSFSDGLILVGVRSLANVIANYDTVRATLRSKTGETVVGVNPQTQKILLTNTAPGNSTTLNTLLAELITNIKALVTATAAITVTGVTAGGGTSGPPVNAATISAVSTALTTTATEIANLLE